MERTRTARQRVEWGEDGTAWVSSVAELDALLDKLAREAAAKPFMVDLVSPSGDSLSIGLGSKKSVLSWIPSGGNPPYYASKGNPEADGAVVFFYRGSWSEFPGWSAISIAAARAAMRTFFQTGARPTTVEWEEV
jgi:immunity protein Imm1 of predicted polymorphic toxin system